MTNNDLFKMLASLTAQRELVMKELQRRNVHYKRYLEEGFKYEAIRQYSKMHNVSITDAAKEISELEKRI